MTKCLPVPAQLSRTFVLGTAVAAVAVSHYDLTADSDC